MSIETYEPRIYNVSAHDREPLLRFMEDALVGSGCRIIRRSSARSAPFRITFETPAGERLGIIAYAFLATRTPTKNRPIDEQTFQIKYGSKAKGLDFPEEHDIWQDPYGMYTTLLLGINPEEGFFVAADPVLHSPTKFFIRVEFKDSNVNDIHRLTWTAWERERHSSGNEPIEVLVGGTKDSFLRYVRFEREALGEDQGHRMLIAEQFGAYRYESLLLPRPSMIALVSAGPTITPAKLHSLAQEFEMSETEVFDLISSAPRLKMAVRGWVAEQHLVRRLKEVPGVSECERIDKEGGADVTLRFRNSRPITIECKNVLRRKSLDKIPRIDFQRTRTSKSDPCSRYYSDKDFDIVAACLHAATESWEFRYRPSRDLAPHERCKGKLTNKIAVDSHWLEQAEVALAAVATM